ncbi:MAG: hypothetical protein HQK83_14250 [Fibrobacteria bacterium]|nr:hypothetical protein [Fibrobacteria bacterium]
MILRTLVFLLFAIFSVFPNRVKAEEEVQWYVNEDWDTEPPVISKFQILLGDGRLRVNGNQITVVIRNVRDKSGVKGYYYGFNTRRKKVIDQMPFLIPLSKEGKNKLYFWVEDSVGNISEPVEREIFLDTKAPELVNFDAKEKGTLRLQFSEAMDTTSSIKTKPALRNYAIHWKSPENLELFGQLPLALKTGLLEIVFTGLTDVAGNHPLKPFSVKVMADTKAPEVEADRIILNDGKSLINTSKVHCSILNIEKESDVTKCFFKLDNKPAAATKKCRTVFKNLEEGKHIIRVKFEDAVGNRSKPVKKIFKIDMTSPDVDSIIFGFDKGKRQILLKTLFSEPMDTLIDPEVIFGSQQCQAGTWSNVNTYLAYYQVNENTAMAMQTLLIKNFYDQAGNKTVKMKINTALPEIVLETFAMHEVSLATSESRKAALLAFTLIKEKNAFHINARRQMASIYKLENRPQEEEDVLRDLAGFMPYSEDIFKRLLSVMVNTKTENSSDGYLTHLLLAQGKTATIEFNQHLKNHQAFFRIITENYLDSKRSYLSLSSEASIFLDNAIEKAQWKDFDKALKQLEKLRDFDSSNAVILYNLATIYTIMGRPDTAIKIFKTLPLEKNTVFAGNYASALALVGDIEGARKLFERYNSVLKIPAFASNYGVVLIKSGLTDQALPYLKKSSGKLKQPELVLNYAWALYSLGKCTNASKVFSYVTTNSPEDYPDAFTGEALCLLAQGQPRKAIASLKKALLLAPYHLDALLSLGELQIRFGESGQAKKLAEYCLKIYPKQTQALKLLAEAKKALTGDDGKPVVVSAWERFDSKKRKEDVSKTAQLKIVPMAILPFKNATKDTALNWISMALSDILYDQLKENPAYTISNHATTWKYLKNKNFFNIYAGLDGFNQYDKLLEKKVIPTLTKATGAHAVLSGSYRMENDKLHLRAFLKEISSGKILKSAMESGPLEDIVSLENNLVRPFRNEEDKPSIQNDSNRSLLPTALIQKKAAMLQMSAVVSNKEMFKDLAISAIKTEPRVLQWVDKDFLKRENILSGKILAVLPFSNLTSRPKDRWIIKKIQTTLINDLDNMDLIVINRKAVQGVMESLAFSPESLDKDQVIHKIGGQLNAQQLITGGFQVNGNTLGIYAHVTQIPSGKLIFATEVSGNKTELVPLIKRLVFDIADALDMTMSKEKRASLNEAKTDSLQLLEDESTFDDNIDDFNSDTESIKDIQEQITERVVPEGTDPPEQEIADVEEQVLPTTQDPSIQEKTKPVEEAPITEGSETLVSENQTEPEEQQSTKKPEEDEITNENEIPEDTDNINDLESVNRILEENNLMGVMEPEKLCKTNKAGRVIQLNLAGLGLSNIPKDIGKFEALESLKLGNNRLQSLPAEIGNLKSLKSLNAERNQLKTLPSHLGNLSQLQSLNISRNNLKTLPREIGMLSNLKTIDANFNQLEHLPGEMGALFNLKKLSLSKNRLSSLPKSILSITPALYISYNKLCNLPRPITAWLKRNAKDKGWDKTQNCMSGK